MTKILRKLVHPEIDDLLGTFGFRYAAIDLPYLTAREQLWYLRDGTNFRKELIWIALSQAAIEARLDFIGTDFDMDVLATGMEDRIEVINLFGYQFYHLDLPASDLLAKSFPITQEAREQLRHELGRSLPRVYSILESKSKND
jgi:hypothetical protein